MTMQNTMAGTAQPAPAENELRPLDLHGLYRQQAACGYTHGINLSSHQAQAIAARLRGITAITSLFIAATDSEALTLGEWLRGGLVEAVHTLAWDVSRDMEEANNRKKGGAA